MEAADWMKVDCKILWAITLAIATCIAASGCSLTDSTIENVNVSGPANLLEDSVSTEESGKVDLPQLEIPRGEHKSLFVESNGVQTELPASLCSGSGYALYLPDDWIQDEPFKWHNEYIELLIEQFAADGNGSMDMQRCYDTITSEYVFDGVDQIDFWTELDNNTFLGACSGSFFHVWLIEHGNDCWALVFMYPAEAAERTLFAAIASTFEFV